MKAATTTAPTLTPTYTMTTIQVSNGQRFCISDRNPKKEKLQIHDNGNITIWQNYERVEYGKRIEHQQIIKISAAHICTLQTDTYSEHPINEDGPQAED